MLGGHALLCQAIHAGYIPVSLACPVVSRVDTSVIAPMHRWLRPLSFAKADHVYQPHALIQVLQSSNLRFRLWKWEKGHSFILRGVLFIGVALAKTAMTSPSLFCFCLKRGRCLAGYSDLPVCTYISITGSFVCMLDLQNEHTQTGFRHGRVCRNVDQGDVENCHPLSIGYAGPGLQFESHML